MSYNPLGYQNLITYKQGQEIYQLTKDFTAKYLDPIKDSRLKSHLDDSGRSVPRNIMEGYKRGNTKSYLEFLGFSRASNEELKGDYTELEREYKEEIRKLPIGINNKDEIIRIVEEILTKIYGEDCMLGRQIKGLEKRYIEKGDERDRLKKDRMDFQKQQIVENWRRKYWS
ncbi:MAG: four helix bundle protein [Patescibacteria group bacterium]